MASGSVARIRAVDTSGRNETDLERCDRNLVELLQEVRVVQTGVQVLFAFLLTAPLAARFTVLNAFQRYDYFATLLAAGAAAILLIAPTAYHGSCSAAGTRSTLSRSPTASRSPGSGSLPPLCWARCCS